MHSSAGQCFCEPSPFTGQLLLIGLWRDPPIVGIEKLPLETIPEVPADSHVYIIGNGQFPLKVSLAYSYCDRCKSIIMRPQGDQTK